MANAGGFIQESIWRDKDFRALPRTAQATYAQLLSQKELDRAGVLPYQPDKWARGCDAMSLNDLLADLDVLQTARFVLIDVDTYEALVRSYMRQSNVIKQPNLLKNAIKCAGMVASDRLRHELAIELRRLGRKDTNAAAENIDPGEGFDNPTGTLSEPIENPSRTHPEGLNPSGTLREPRGVGEGVGENLRSPVVKEGGRARTYTHTREDDQPDQPSNDPPNPTCPRHPTGTDEPCSACRRARQARAQWDTKRADAEKARLNLEAETTSRRAREAAELRAAEIERCDLCDDDGYLLGDDVVGICTHNPTQADTNRRGIEAVRAAMTRPKKPA